MNKPKTTPDCTLQILATRDSDIVHQHKLGMQVNRIKLLNTNLSVRLGDATHESDQPWLGSRPLHAEARTHAIQRNVSLTMHIPTQPHTERTGSLEQRLPRDKMFMGCVLKCSTLYEDARLSS